MTKTVSVTKPAAKATASSRAAFASKILDALATPVASKEPTITAGPAASEQKPDTSEKKVAPKVPLNARTAKKGSPVYVIAETARPGSGRALFAHTNAALTALGMLKPERPAVPKSSVLTLMGQRAVTHHLRSGNFEDAPDTGLRLSSAGLGKFRERQGTLDVPLANSFLDLILDGNTAGTAVAKGNVYQAKL